MSSMQATLPIDADAAAIPPAQAHEPTDDERVEYCIVYELPIGTTKALRKPCIRAYGACNACPHARRQKPQACPQCSEPMDEDVDENGAAWICPACGKVLPRRS